MADTKTQDTSNADKETKVDAGQEEVKTAAEELTDEKITAWTNLLKNSVKLASEPSDDHQQPFDNIYKALKLIVPMYNSITKLLQSTSNNSSVDPILKFRLQFMLIHTLSSLAKWYEICEEYSNSEKYHIECLSTIEKVIKMVTYHRDVGCDKWEENEKDEIIVVGVKRCQFLLIYQKIRFAIVFSEISKQEEALNLLISAEDLFHNFKKSSDPNHHQGIQKFDALYAIDSINSDTVEDNILEYLLFYLGQAYKISGEKERAIHMVLRRQLEKGDITGEKAITWAADVSKMASVVSSMDCFEAANNIIAAATAVLQNNCSEEIKATDAFKQNYAEIGRCWAKFGNELLEASCDRLKDLEEQTRKPTRFKNKKMVLRPAERQSLGIDCVQEEYDTVLLVQNLHFPTLDLKAVKEKEMRGKYVRDFDEARQVFLPLQRWINIAKSYYVIDEYASDYIDIMTDYSNAFKYIAFFEPSLERQVKMHKRRILILEDLIANLIKVYDDVCHFCLRELAEINETIYKLKVAELKERGLSLRPKDKKLVKWLYDGAVGAHKRNLANFEFDVDNSSKDFSSDYEKSLLGSVLSVGRILGSICHDHPLHPSSLDFAIEAKKYYLFFLRYLDNHQTLKLKDFQVLYDGTRDMPELLDRQIAKISEHASSQE